VLVRDAQRNVQNYKTIPIFDRLLAYYPFDGNINDQSGNGRHLIAKDNDSSPSAPSFRQNSVGENNAAIDLIGRASSTDNQPNYYEYEFPGGLLSSQFNSVVYLGDSKNYTRIDNYTISYWALADTNTQQANSAMFSTVNNTDLGFQFALRDMDSDSISEFMVKYEDLSIDPTAGQQMNDVVETDVQYSEINVGNWSHVTVTFDGTNMKIFGNGSLIQTITGGVTAFDRFRVGRNRNGDKYFDGGLDEIRIYGQALTDEEVSTLYQSELAD